MQIAKCQLKPFRVLCTTIRCITTPGKTSYLKGPCTEPLLSCTIPQVFTKAAGEFGDVEGVVSCHQNIRKTYSQIEYDITKLAAGFLAIGMKPGDRLGIWGPNSYEWYLTMFAAIKAGLILVTVNPACRSNELKYFINTVGMKGMVFAENFKTSNYYEMLRGIFEEKDDPSDCEVFSKDAPSFTTLVNIGKNKHKGSHQFGDVLRIAESKQFNELNIILKNMSPMQPCNIQFTSGTTGLPKGAVLSQHGIVNNAYFTGRRCNYHEKHVNVCLPLPLYHCFGNVLGALCCAIFRSTLTLPSAVFDTKSIVKTLKEEKTNGLYGTPTMFVDVLREVESQNLCRKELNLECGMMAGAPCPEELVNAVMNELGMKRLFVLFGMTETSPVSLQCFQNDPLETRVRTVGYPSDWTEVKIADENGDALPIGETGEICTRGYLNFLGYFKDKKKTAEMCTSDGWLKTGDLGAMDERGYCTIKGRKKDVIIRGGENIYPAEVEDFYCKHPSIVDAHVFGVPDARMGEEVAMWVRAKVPQHFKIEDIREWSKGKISHYKIPRYISVKDQFPLTTTGKVQKFKMKEIALREYKIS